MGVSHYFIKLLEARLNDGSHQESPGLGMRSEDILSCARWLAGACGQEKVGLQAANWAVTPTLHAAVAEPEIFSAVESSQAPDTWSEVVSKGTYHRFSDIVHGALREYGLEVLKSKVPVK